MPYKVKKRDGQYCVVKADGSREFGCHPTPDEAYTQIAAIEASESKSISVLDAVKAVSVAAGPPLEGRIHEVFTVIADRLFQGGVLSREERIALSGGIGKTLKKLSDVIVGLGLDSREVPPGILLDLAAKALSGQPVSDHWIHNVMVSSGDNVKDLNDKGLVGGYLVVFSPDGRKDIMGDYFTRDTDFRWRGKERRLAIYHHGLDQTMGKKAVGNDWRLAKVDDVGLWVESQLDMRKEYERAIHGMAKAGKMGLSSGTASHLIDKERDGQINLWAIVEGSYTPTPMEQRAVVTPLSRLGSVQPFRSLMSIQQQRKGQAVGVGAPGAEEGSAGVRQIELADPIELVQAFIRRR